MNFLKLHIENMSDRFNTEPSLYSLCFSLEICIEGLNSVFTQLYGVSLLAEVWNEDVHKLACQLMFSHLIGHGVNYCLYLMSHAVASMVKKQCFYKDPLNRFTGLDRGNDAGSVAGKLESVTAEMLVNGGGKESMLMVEGMLQRRPSIKDSVKAPVSDPEPNFKTCIID